MTAAVKLPDDLQLIETWLYECSNPKPRGALARTARRYGCSDQYVSNVVKHHRQSIQEPAEPADIYNPDTGAYEAVLLAAWREERQRTKEASLLCRLVAEEPPTPAQDANDANSALQSPVGILDPIANTRQSQPYEFAFERERPIANTNEEAYAWGLLALLLTACFFAMSVAQLPLALLMSPCVLGIWWCFGEARML